MRSKKTMWYPQKNIIDVHWVVFQILYLGDGGVGEWWFQILIKELTLLSLEFWSCRSGENRQFPVLLGNCVTQWLVFNQVSLSFLEPSIEAQQYFAISFHPISFHCMMREKDECLSTSMVYVKFACFPMSTQVSLLPSSPPPFPTMCLRLTSVSHFVPLCECGYVSTPCGERTYCQELIPILYAELLAQALVI